MQNPQPREQTCLDGYVCQVETERLQREDFESHHAHKRQVFISPEISTG